jgi:hypothetical protein
MLKEGGKPSGNFPHQPDLWQMSEMGVAGGEFAIPFAGDRADPDVVGRDRRALGLKLIEQVAVEFRGAAAQGRQLDLGLAQEVIELGDVFRGVDAFAKPVEKLAEDDAGNHDPVGDGDVGMPASGATPVAVGISDDPRLGRIGHFP